MKKILLTFLMFITLISTPALAQGIDEYTALLLHFDGADTSTTFTDSSDNNMTATVYDNAQVDTDATDAFGGNAGVGLFDGTNDRITFPDHAAFDIGTGDFCVEFWVNGTAGNYDAFFNLGQTNNMNIVQSGTTGKLRIWFGTTNIVTIGNTSVMDGSWHHVALSREGTTVRSFVDGVKEDEVTNSSDVTPTDILTVAGTGTPRTYDLIGKLDEFRISVGVPRYTANFTPPTEAFSDSGATYMEFR